MSRAINIDLDKFILHLLCWYAFFIPLERILNVFFQIDTILKPYRVFAILIILLFVLRSRFRWNRNPELSEDKYLYLIFLYGVFITLVRMITNTFNMGLLFNDLFQLGLYLGVFIVVRHMGLTKKEITRIFIFLSLGMLVNALYIFNNFFILRQYGRNGGFMDNPNYLAFGLQLVIVFMTIRFARVKGQLKKAIWLTVMLFLGYIFIAAGSRTGLLLLVISFMLILYFSSLKVKGTLIVLLLGTGIFLAVRDEGEIEGGGPLILVNRIQHERENEDNRIPIWEGVIRASESTNFLGMGIGQFKARFREFYVGENNDLVRRIISKDYFLSPHSDYFMLLAVYGVVGLVSYLIFAFLSVKKAFYKYMRAEDTSTKEYYQLGFLMITSLILFGITNENVYNPLFWIVMTLATRLGFPEEEKEDTYTIEE